MRKDDVNGKVRVEDGMTEGEEEGWGSRGKGRRREGTM